MLIKQEKIEVKNHDLDNYQIGWRYFFRFYYAEIKIEQDLQDVLINFEENTCQNVNHFYNNCLKNFTGQINSDFFELRSAETSLLIINGRIEKENCRITIYPHFLAYLAVLFPTFTFLSLIFLSIYDGNYSLLKDFSWIIIVVYIQSLLHEKFKDAQRSIFLKLAKMIKEK